MEKYKQLLNMVMDFNESVRFAAVSDAGGHYFGIVRTMVLAILSSIEKTKATMSRSRSEWDIMLLPLNMLEMDCICYLIFKN